MQAVEDNHVLLHKILSVAQVQENIEISLLLMWENLSSCVGESSNDSWLDHHLAQHIMLHAAWLCWLSPLNCHTTQSQFNKEPKMMMLVSSFYSFLLCLVSSKAGSDLLASTSPAQTLTKQTFLTQCDLSLTLFNWCHQTCCHHWFWPLMYLHHCVRAKPQHYSG